MEDEDRLVAIRSTASALRKEEEELNQRIKEKAVLRDLDQKLEMARETDKAKFEESLRTAEEDIQAISAKHDKLATELAVRNSSLSECQTRNQHLLEELVSYRAESFELRGTTAAFREQYEVQVRRGANLDGRFQSLAHHSYAPCRMDTNPVSQQPYGAHQVPAGQPQVNDVMEQDEQHVSVHGPQHNDHRLRGSPTRSDAAQSGGSFHTAHASSHDQADSEASAEEEEPLELARDSSLGADLQENVKELSCISKCEQKDVGVAETEAEGATVRALHAVNLTLNPVLPPHPPVQASRGGCKEGHAATLQDIAEEPTAEVAVVPAPDVVQSPAAAAESQAPSAPLPSPPRKVVYVTPLPPHHLAAMSTEEQQTYKDALHRVCLPYAPSTPAPTPAGVYVTPLPPQLHSSSMHEVKEQRANRRVGARAGSRTGPADVQSTGGTSSISQRAVANSQGVEAPEAQKRARKNAKKARKKKASQQRASAGS
ncbi:hypothetical protein ABBQ32_013364 [Trebouxia sp. C0010 RCD-2024]